MGIISAHADSILLRRASSAGMKEGLEIIKSKPEGSAIIQEHC
jgi:hypothetical protein